MQRLSMFARAPEVPGSKRYILHFRKGSFQFEETFVSPAGAVARSAALQAEGACEFFIYDVDGNVVMSDGNIVNLSRQR